MRTALKFKKICCGVALFVAPALTAVTTGCGFFPPLNQCTTDCTTTTDFIYVANTSNTTASPPSVAGFSLTTTTVAATTTTAATSTLALAATPGSAYSLGYIPSAMSINPANNSFVYVASLTGGIYLYSISTTGALTVQNNGTAVATGFPGLIAAALQVDTTGAYLIVAGASSPTTAASVTVYSIASSTGLLTSLGSLTLKTAGASNRLAMSADGTNVFLTLGTGGVESFTFTSSTGVLADIGNLPTKAATNGDVDVTTSPDSTLAFVTETGTAGVRVFIIGTSGGLTEVTASPFATGTGPAGVLVDSTGTYVYVTNRTTNNISEYTLLASGAATTLTQIAGSPFTTCTTPVDIAEDASDLYVGVVCNGGNQDLEVYSFDATTLGKLDAAANAMTGTDPTLPIAIAATH